MKTKFDEDDPRLTAFALGELEGDERAEIEALVAKDEKAREAAEDIREMAKLLGEGFAGEPEARLSEQQVEAILDGSDTGNKVASAPDRFSRFSKFTAFAAVAACLAVVAGVGLRDYFDGLKSADVHLQKLREPAAAEHAESGGPGAPGVPAVAADNRNPFASRSRNAHAEGTHSEPDAVNHDAFAVVNGATHADPLGGGEDTARANLKTERGTVTKRKRRKAGRNDDAAAPAQEALGFEKKLSKSVRGLSEYSAPSRDEMADKGAALATQSATTAPAVPPAPAPAAGAGIADSPGAESDGAVVAGTLGPEAKREATVTAAKKPASRANDALVEHLNVAGETRADAAVRGRRRSAEFTEAQKELERAKAALDEKKKQVTGRFSRQPADDEASDAETVQLARFQQQVDDARAKLAVIGAEEERKLREVGFLADRIPSGESYAPLVDNPFVSTWEENVSTFSIDVDTGAYSNARRFVMKNGQLPPRDAVRIEEMINYFDYGYPQPEEEGRPFSVNLEVASCPWKKEHRLLRIGLKGREMHKDRRPPSNLVFLIDVSGSMKSADKLPLLKKSMIALANNLNEDDTISIVVYASRSGMVLEPTSGDLKDKITGSLERLSAGGSTNGGEGIQLAYAAAKEHFIEGGVNRVILATDGDFNVGVTDTAHLIEMVERHAKDDRIFLTVLGFGTGNIKEDRMEQIADKGNGNYFYIDREREGKRVLVDKLSATLVAIAKDVKIQVDFNPAKVAKYRLIGYANRIMPNQHFRDDTRDAGEIGAGHTVTALYEILPVGPGGIDAAAEVAMKSKYLSNAAELEAKRARLVDSDELVTVRLRYKKPDEDTSVEFEEPLVDPGDGWVDSSYDFRFAAAVAGYGIMLRNSDYKGGLNYDLVLELAEEGIGDDEHGLRQEFVDLVKRSKGISGQ